jgi:hypothetical protein
VIRFRRAAAVGVVIALATVVVAVLSTVAVVGALALLVLVAEGERELWPVGWGIGKWVPAV